jgi:D-lactate dehydrogenase (cytochrome)
MGATRPWVERLRLLLPDGTAVEARRGEFVSEGGRFVLKRSDAEVELPVPTHARPAIKNAGGPYSSSDGAVDFVDLVVGSEGLFGIVTACTLSLADRPADYLDLFFSLPGEADALKLHAFLSADLEGGVESLTAFEYFGVNCRNHMDHQERLFRGNDAVAIYLQVPLRDADADAEEAAMAWLERLLASDCGIDEEAILMLDNERDRAVFMEARHSMPANALEVVKHRGSFTIMTDTVVPADRFAAFLEFTHGRLNAEKLDYLAFGHFGDCHLHFTILPRREDIDRAVGVYDEIVAKSAEFGGVYSGEHGTGKRKRKDFVRCYGEDAAQRVLACKRAVDPGLLLNRGNVVEA